MDFIREQLSQAIHHRYGVDDFALELVPSPANIPADYSTSISLRLAKVLHQSPMEIATELGEELRKEPSFSTSISSPGFLNFTLSEAYLSAQISALAYSFEESIKSSELKGQTIICEFSDPNPFKVLHVGHLYTSIVGDSISRLFEYAGGNVVRANFGGDVGLHVAKTMYILRQKDASSLDIEDIAKCYIEGTAAYEDDEAAKQEITKLNKEIYQINADKIHDTPLSDLYWHARELSYDYFRDFYAQIGVKFDKFYPESTVAKLGLETVEKQLKNGVYELSDGAVIFDGNKYGLHTRVFINKEGVPTYEAKDVGLIFTKWQDYHFDKSVVITGSEQLDYMKVVLKSVEQYAPELVHRTTHLTHGLVKLPGGVKMSSRRGNFLRAVDVLDMVRGALAQEYDSTDEVVSLAATKYAFLRYKMGGQIIFDPKESVKMTGNSGPYLLYSAVRAKKILSKVTSKKEACTGDGPVGESPLSVSAVEEKKVWQYPSRSIERSLARKLLEYKSVLQNSVTEMAPHKVANYLYELAQEFSRFYEHCPVAGSEQESERAQLVQVYLDTMTHGLNILGIEIPEEM